MVRNLLLQVFIFSAIFLAMSALRETSMLSKETEINSVNTLISLTGKQVNIQSQGEKTVLYFFAPWCQVCHVSIGNLEQLHQKQPHLKIVAIALDFTSEKEVNRFASRHQLSFDIVLGNEEVKQTYNITGYPSYYVLSEQNTVVSRSLGYSSELGLYLRTF